MVVGAINSRFAASSPTLCLLCSLSLSGLSAPPRASPLLHYYHATPLLPSSDWLICFSDGLPNSLVASGLESCCAAGSEAQTAVRA